MSEVSKKTSYHHGNLREELVATGLRILETDGLRALTIREVARCLGVTSTAPLHHFATKNALLAAIAAQGFRLLFDERMAALKGGGTQEERLSAVLMAYVRFAMAHPALYELMHGPHIMDKSVYPELSEAAIRSYSLLETVVGDYLLARDGTLESSEDAALAAWTISVGVATALTNPQNTPRYVLRKDPLGVAQRIFKMFLRGLARPPADGPRADPS